MIGLSIILSPDKGEGGRVVHRDLGFRQADLAAAHRRRAGVRHPAGPAGPRGLIPSAWVSGAVGGNSLWANFFASVAGAFMYFATLTEVPILQGLIGSGMGKGPALALLLAGPALSLPSMLVLRSIMGLKKTVVFTSLVVVLSTIVGFIFGNVLRFKEVT